MELSAVVMLFKLGNKSIRRMKMVKSAIRLWFGFGFLIMGLIGFYQSMIIALAFIFIGTLFLYPFFTGFSKKERLVCILAMSVFTAISYGYQYRGAKVAAEQEKITAEKKAEQEKQMREKQLIIAKEQAEKKAELEKQLAKEFADNQESILSNAKQLLDQEKYSDVVTISRKYAFAHNQELDKFGQEAQRMEKKKLLSVLGNQEGLYIGMPMQEAIDKFKSLLKSPDKCYNAENFNIETTNMTSWVPPFQGFMKFFRAKGCNMKAQLVFAHDKLIVVELDSLAASLIFRIDVSSKNFVRDFMEETNASITDERRELYPDKGLIIVFRSYTTSIGDTIQMQFSVSDKGGNEKINYVSLKKLNSNKKLTL